MLLGYAITGATVVSFVVLLSVLVYDRKELWQLLKKNISRNDAAILAAIVAFFIGFSVLYVTPSGQLYFDESIYQGIALNILFHGNALWCQAGTGYLRQCFSSLLYHDPVDWSVFLAAAFAVSGIGTGTAYALQLLVGAVSIIGIFLLSSLLWKKRLLGISSALVLVLMPPLFVWSRTQAVTDLPFMAFSIFTFFFFVLFARRPNAKTFSVFASCLVITLYSRIEAILLIPIFLLLYFTLGDKSIRKTARLRLDYLASVVDKNIWFLAALLFFFILILPQLYYISLQFQTGDYGQGSSNQLFSLQNFIGNAQVNGMFLLGKYSTVYLYPEMFSGFATALAVIGVLLLLLDRKAKNRFGVAVMLLAWFIAYFLFYGFFYAGSAGYGVDSRFMLQLMPVIVIGASLGLSELYGFLRAGIGIWPGRVAYYALVAAFVVYPFASMIPVITLSQQAMPQQAVIAPAVNFIYNNYYKVPANCMVFSFTPDMWWELNRSSAEISYLGSHDYNISRFSCYVIDYGYWCNVPPFHSGTCSDQLSKYDLSVIAENYTGSSHFAFYLINNYSR